MVFRRALVLEFLQSVDDRVHLAAKPFPGFPKRTRKVRGQHVADEKQIDVAVAPVASVGDRTVHEGQFQPPAVNALNAINVHETALTALKASLSLVTFCSRSERFGAENRHVFAYRGRARSPTGILLTNRAVKSTMLQLG
jgi:hypothetical protein